MSNYTTLPSRGDIAVYGSDRQVRFIKYDSTYDGIPSGMTAFGNVIERNGKDVLIANKTAESKKWADVFLWKITGYTLDGSEHTMSLTANSVTKSITYSDTTLAGLASTINTAIADGFGAHTYTCYVRDGELILQHNTYTTYVAVTATGVTVAARVGTENKANSSCARLNGGHSGEGAIINLDRALIYFNADLSSTTYNPNADVTSVQRPYPICKPGYLGTSAIQTTDHCAYLRSIYGGGEDGWKAFMQDMMLVNPEQCGVIGESGKRMTYRLAGQKYTAADSTEKTLYPAIDYAAAVGYDADGIEVGNWYLPNMNEVCAMQRGITYPAKYENGASVSVPAAEADIFTRSRNAIGATLVGNSSSVWSSCRYGSSGCWGCRGSYGYSNSASFYLGYDAVPVALYTLA